MTYQVNLHERNLDGTVLKSYGRFDNVTVATVLGIEHAQRYASTRNMDIILRVSDDVGRMVLLGIFCPPILPATG